MSNTAPSPSEKPFHVFAVGGTIHSGYDTEALAEVACEDLNKKAEALGMKGRYEVRSRD